VTGTPGLQVANGTAQALDSLSPGQRYALDEIVAWYRDGGEVPLTLGGLAGTGKTTLVGLLPFVLPRRAIAFMAYTGKAVSVLAAKLPAEVPSGLVSTIHRRLYQPQVAQICTGSDEILWGKTERCWPHRDRDELCPFREQVGFAPVEAPLAGIDLVVVDEASMVPEKLWTDLTSHNVPVLAVGDHGQLPPVRSAFNLMARPQLRLEEIHRQAAGSPILAVARWAREQGHIPHGWYGPDVVKIRPDELGLVGLHPAESDMIICATNMTRMFHNNAMRATFGRTGPPQAGDVVICLRNNYNAGLFNGQRGVITKVKGNVVAHKTPAIEMTIDLEGLAEKWSGAVVEKQFGSPDSLTSLPRELALFDYGYTITAHKSQGSAANNVIVIEEGWPQGPDRPRWLYTAVTRSAEQLTVVGWT
jgi:AAA domain-containing protein/UvrD-like helicase family protein